MRQVRDELIVISAIRWTDKQMFFGATQEIQVQTGPFQLPFPDQLRSFCQAGMSKTMVAYFMAVLTCPQ